MGFAVFHNPIGAFRRKADYKNDYDAASYSSLQGSGVGGLADTKIEDQIPDGLKILTVESRINSKTESDYNLLSLVESGSGYLYNETTRILSYSIPSDAVSPDELIKRVDLRITAQLTEEEFNTYLASSMKPEEKKIWKFPNKALLKTLGNELVAVSNRVEPKLELGAPYTKDKENLDTSNHEFKWTVKVNSFFTNQGAELYAVDYIKNVGNSHNYICTGDNSGITIIGEDKTPVSRAITDLGAVGAEYSYDQVVNIGVIEKLRNEKNITDLTAPLVYKYPTGGMDGTEEIYDAIMLIPLSDFKNAPVKIEYTTRSTIDFTDVSKGEVPVDLTNDVKVLWRWPEGGGPGPGSDFGGADVGKDYPVVYSLLKKTGDYSDTDNTITWNFDVNQFGKKIDCIRITDDFDDTKNKLIDPNGLQPLILKFAGTEETARTKETARTVPYSQTDLGEAHSFDFYTITQAGDKKTLLVHLVNLNSNGGDKDHFTFSVKSEVTDEELIGTGTKVTITNKAHADALIDNNKISADAEATCEAINTLIRKTKVAFEPNQYYDYTKNLVKWNVTINPRGWDIISPAVSDKLPAGTVFAELTGVTCHEKEIDAVTGEVVTSKEIPLTLTPPDERAWSDTAPPAGTWEANGAGVKVSVKQDAKNSPLQFQFKSAEGTSPLSIKNKSFSLEFTTYVTEEHRRTVFKSNASATLKNEATFTGTLNGSTSSFSAVDEAENNFEPKPMLKTGEYLEFKDYDIGDGKLRDLWGMNWELYVNRTGANMGNAVVSDQIQEFMELIPKSMKVSTVELNADGTEKAGSATVIYTYPPSNPDTSMILDYSGFKYTIPTEQAKKTLKFEFTTIMVDDAYADEMTNSVSIKGDTIEDTTGDSKADKVKDFQVADYASAKGVYFAKIYKTSANETGKFPLKGATFAIYKLTPPEKPENRANAESWTANSSPLKTRVSNKRGGVSFMFLEEGAMYKIVETEAPTGYEKSSDSWYVVPKTTSNETYPVPVEDQPAAAGTKYSVNINSGKSHYVNVSIKNKTTMPAPGAQGSVYFIKRGQNGQILPGVEFTIRYPGLKAQTVKSDAAGKVEFKNLDPLPKGKSYKITEVVPAGYENSGRLKCEVAVYVEGNEVKTEFTDARVFSKETIDGVETNVFKNTPVSRSAAFTKSDQNSDALLGTTVTFKVERRGDGGATLVQEPGAAADKLKICLDVDNDIRVDAADKKNYFDYPPGNEVVSDSAGLVTLTNLLYGDYKLTETNVSPDNLLPSLLGGGFAVLYLRVNNEGIYASAAEFTDTTDLGSEAAPKLTDLGDTFSVKNRIQYGVLQINKAVGEKNDTGKLVATSNPSGLGITYIPIEGLTFDIFKADTTGIQIGTEPFMTLTTNVDGKFNVDEATGIYTIDPVETGVTGVTKQLVVGKYILKERKDSKGDYTVPEDNALPFEITSQSLDPDKFVPTVKYMDQEGNVTESKTTFFLNEPARGQLELKKVDGDYKDVHLSGAEFKVYTKGADGKKGDYVADLVETTSSPTTYVLAPATHASGGENVVARNSEGKLYIQKKSENEFELLHGEYRIEESKFPTVANVNPEISYEKPAGLFSVTIEAGKVTTVKNPGETTTGDMKNYVKKHNFTIQKRVETWKQGTSDKSIAEFDKYVNGEADFEFTLSSVSSKYPGPVNMPATGTYSKMVPTNANGLAKFDDIPIGTYLLKETKVPTKYGEIGTSKDVYVEPMKEIMVVVDGNGTTFSYVDNSQLADSPLTEDTSGVKDSVADNGAADVVLTVRNNYKIGSAAGNKVGIFPAGTSGGSEHALARATFTLTEKNTKLKLETTSDASGDINFTNVPYGVYTVTETAAPAGYKAIAPFDVTINADQSAVPLKPAGNVREELEDTFILKTIQFLKVDQNGEPLGKGRQPIAFEITRNSDSAPENLPNGYSLPQTAETDENGVVKVKLPYGSYTFKEAVNQDSIITGTAPEFTVVIESDSVTTANTKVTIKAVDDATGTSITQADDADGGGTYDFTGATNSFKLENSVKTGDIRINKQLGEIGTDGAIVDAVDAGKPLAGTTFKIYRQVKDADGNEVLEQNAFITLNTRSDGSFETDAAGKYAGKELLVGSTYYLEEYIPANSIYKPLADVNGLTHGKLEFTVPARESRTVTEFTYNGNTVKHAVVNTDASQGKFYNIPKRGTITVNKQDSENNETLSNAEFGIYTDAACTEGNKVAVLKESAAAGEKGRYILDGAGFTKENENGISYVYRPADSKPWKILAGSYWIKETTVPEGYTPPAQPTPVTVKDEVQGTENQGTENQGQTITNTLAQVDIKFQKVDQNGDLVKNIAVNGVTDARKISFTLTRLPSSADGQTMTDLDTRAAALINSQQISNDAAGMVEIKNLLKGTYTLTEAANSWITNPPTVYITVDQNQNNTLKVTLSATKDPVADSNRKELSSIAQTTGNPLCDFSQGTEAYKLENQLIYGLVDIKKVAAERDADGKLEALTTPIEGVIFHIYEDINADGKYLKVDADSDPVLVTITGTDGRFKFGADSKYADDTGKLQDNRLVYGKTYFLKEYKLPVKDNFDKKYMPDPNPYAFTVKGSEIIYIGTKKLTDIAIPADMGAVTDTTGPDTVFPNGPVSRGGITIKKTDADESLNSKAVTGAEFDVYVNSGEKLKVAEMRDNSDGTYELQPLKGASPENSAGQAYLKESGGSYELLSGKYYIKEAKAPAGYITPEDKPENYWYFAIAGDGKKLENEDLTTVDGASKKLVTNTLWTRTITVQKMLENLLPDKFHAAGTQATDDSFSFELKAKNGVTANGKEFEPETRTVEPAGINQGKAIFADIPAGEYTLTEIMTGPAKQDGILSDVYAVPKTISVTVNEKGVFYDGSTANATQITVQNLLKRGSITGKKIAIDSDGKPVNLANAEFTLTPVAPARSGTLTAVSNSKGEFTFQNVPLGEYELRETKTPDSSYEISDKTCRVKVTAENQNVTSDTTAAPIEFVNHASGSFTIEKREQIVRNNDINGVMVPGAGFTFKLTGTSPVDGQLQDFFDTANVEGAATVEKKADGIYVTTGITGIITFNHLPVGDYTVREQINDKTSATGPYLPDEKEKTVKITINHATGKVAVSPEAGVKVDNYLKRGQIEGLKTTADKTTPLAGAVIGLFPSTTTAFTEENLWCGQKVTTGEDGKYLFQKVPYGTYLVAELTAPSGYNLNTTTRYEVTVADDKTVKTTGFLLEGEQPKAAAESPILIANAKKSSGGGGGGGGGGTKPQEPTGPGPGTPTTSPNETSPVNPGESVPGPTNPGETTPDSPLPTLPVETAPGGGNEVIIPPETPPGSDIEIKNPNGDTVYTGKVDENGRVHVDLPPGTYTIVTFDENQVPLGSMTFTIEDPFTPLAALAAPDAGDHSVPIVVLAVLMMISLAGMILVARKKKGDKQNPSGKE